ncbi:MAG: GH32 C-terminal domain-containing protein [Muribaculaceae bacterium]
MINVIRFQNKISNILILLYISISPLLLLSNNESATISFSHLGDNKSMINQHINHNFLILPIQESSQEVRINIILDNDIVKTLNARLAVDSVDYYVPIDLANFKDQKLSISILNVNDSAICWNKMNFADTFSTNNYEKYRPSYHFTPLYGWMNDPNGMVYKDGIYHLFYQYNPFGSMWGNMNWGHATSTDLVTWKHFPVAIEPDGLGMIFSGSCVVDTDNSAGFGKNAIVAFYTSAAESQVQSMAYSLDGGNSFIKYSENPILTSSSRDFRDPKVIWHKSSKKWIMVLAAGQEMQFYSSPNLKDWSYESSFGKNQGAHGGVWECPDLFELNIEGSNISKWVLLCNINPGGPFGGSATQYFIGTFDGKNFTNDSPSITKLMDYGKDHYATVTWSDAPNNRRTAIAWMSNWQYANNVPTKQYRSANSVARDLSLFSVNGEVYLKSEPVKELIKVRENHVKQKSFKVNSTHTISNLLKNNSGAYEIEMSIINNNAKIISFSLFNNSNEKVDFIYNISNNTFSVDRTKSGIVNFSSDFPAITVSPIYENGTLNLRIFVDNSSIEVFGNGGKFVLTNLIYPTTPYNNLQFSTDGGSYSVKNFVIYKINN